MMLTIGRFMVSAMDGHVPGPITPEMPPGIADVVSAVIRGIAWLTIVVCAVAILIAAAQVAMKRRRGESTVNWAWLLGLTLVLGGGAVAVALVL